MRGAALKPDAACTLCAEALQILNRDTQRALRPWTELDIAIVRHKTLQDLTFHSQKWFRSFSAASSCSRLVREGWGCRARRGLTKDLGGT